MNYLIHKKCGNQIYLDITPLTKIITHFGISTTKLKIGIGKLLVLGNSCETVFYCLQCEEDVKDILGVCLNCANYFEVQDLWVLTESGGMYCDVCSKAMGETRRNLTNILSTMNLK